MRSTAPLAVATSVLFFFATADRAPGQTPHAPLRINAFAVNMSNIGTGRTNMVQIEIDRWSTDAEREQLNTAFATKGPDALLRALQKTKRVGFVRLPNTLGYDLHYARNHPAEDGGEQIIILTDRYIGFWEARNQPRIIDYPFTLFDIRVKSNGEGEGKASVATKITYNKKKTTVELENYASEPVRLQNLKVEPKK
jgi:hypothetical protein